MMAMLGADLMLPKQEPAPLHRQGKPRTAWQQAGAGSGEEAQRVGQQGWGPGVAACLGTMAEGWGPRRRAPLQHWAAAGSWTR